MQYAKFKSAAILDKVDADATWLRQEYLMTVLQQLPSWLLGRHLHLLKSLLIVGSALKFQNNVHNQSLQNFHPCASFLQNMT